MFPQLSSWINCRFSFVGRLGIHNLDLYYSIRMCWFGTLLMKNRLESQNYLNGILGHITHPLILCNPERVRTRSLHPLPPLRYWVHQAGAGTGVVLDLSPAGMLLYASQCVRASSLEIPLETSASEPLFQRGRRVSDERECPGGRLDLCLLCWRKLNFSKQMRSTNRWNFTFSINQYSASNSKREMFEEPHPDPKFQPGERACGGF